MLLNPTLEATIEQAKSLPIPKERKEVLHKLVEYIQKKKDNGEPVLLNFICTHNSRRSQFGQIWAKTLATEENLDILSFSGGVEVTAFNKRAIASIKRAGFLVSHGEGENPIVEVRYSQQSPPIIAYSKVYDDASNPTEGFAAIMTCSHADANCPYIPGAEVRIPVMYDDPKDFDGTDEEAIKYDERSMQIASELSYAFSRVI
ncbi:MAG: protein-tyrosine-phosphatase [Balneolales bacterium]